MKYDVFKLRCLNFGFMFSYLFFSNDLELLVRFYKWVLDFLDLDFLWR